VSIRSRFREQKGLLWWLYSRRKGIGAFILETAAQVREARKGPDSFTRAAEEGAERLRVGDAARDYGVPPDMERKER
jgi:hypothetical protein